MVVAALDSHAGVKHEPVGRKPVEADFHDVVVLRQQRIEVPFNGLQADQRLDGVLELVAEEGVEAGRPAIVRTELETIGNRVRLVEVTPP